MSLCLGELTGHVGGRINCFKDLHGGNEIGERNVREKGFLNFTVDKRHQRQAHVFKNIAEKISMGRK